MTNPAEDGDGIEGLTLGELKKELIDLGDPSFVFDDQDELVIALRMARKSRGLTGKVTPKKSAPGSGSGGGGGRPSARIKVIPEIPTMKEDPSEVDKPDNNIGSGSGGGGGGILRRTRKGRRNSLKNGNHSTGSGFNGGKFKKISPNHSVADQKDESIRLVEYFVMVSTKEKIIDPDSAEEKKTEGSSGQALSSTRVATRPPDPSKDKLDARTLSRFETRKVHLQGVNGHQDNDPNQIRLSSIGNYSVVSSPSTCSSEDCRSDVGSSFSGVNGSVRSGISGRSGRSGRSGGGGGVGQDGMRPSANGMDPPMMPPSVRVHENTDVMECLLEPVITARYPPEDRPDQPLNGMLPQFCHPGGTDVLHPCREYQMPRIHHFVLTDSKAGKLYGTCLTVYEEFTPSSEITPEDGTPIKKLYAPRVLCLLSTWPYLSSFRTYLTQLYRLATTTDLMEAPIERYILNICEEIPAPPPGAFEVRLQIMQQQIRFWAPPAAQPIPYVSVNFKALFECLDIGNIMFTWYTLACERKVLLVSDQLSLLTVCSEILCSLLFPMKWSHLYIPVLPRSLSPMLDAPMPYLCGISRANFPYAVQDIGDETVVVDLDRNVITVGPETPDLPPIPHKRRLKLEHALEAHVGDVFWSARGLTHEEAHAIKRKGSAAATEEMHTKADAVWYEKISTIDDAFNLAHAPDATSLLLNDDAKAGVDGGKQSRWDAVQEAFLRFYCAMLKEYRKFLPAEATGTDASWRGPNGNADLRFQTEDFVLSQRPDFQPFLEELTATQQFDDFITKRIYNAGNEPDVAFFDHSIDAKKSRSMLKFKKADTAFLHSASAHKKLSTYDAMLPNRNDVNESAYSKIGVNGRPVYQYPIWPEEFDESLFGYARPIPTNITAEFERRIALKAKLKARTKEIKAKRNMSDDGTVSTSFSYGLDA